MKHLILTVAIILTTSLTAQLNINNDFDSWSFTNTAGVESYNAITTTLSGGQPYPNNDSVIMSSPIYDVNGDLTVSYDVLGVIEQGYDFMYFQYNLNSSGWVDLDVFTGFKNKSVEHTLESVSKIQFRFILVTDESINSYYTNSHNGNHCPTRNLFYYDIFNWSIEGQGNALPVEFGSLGADCESVWWNTLSEWNSSHFELEYSVDGIIWVWVSTIHAQGNSVQNTVYNVSYTNSNHKYFRLTQYDYDGANEMLGVVSVDCGNEEKTIQGIYNLQGQKVTMDSVGIKIIRYSDHTIEKIK